MLHGFITLVPYRQRGMGHYSAAIPISILIILVCERTEQLSTCVISSLRWLCTVGNNSGVK